MKCSVCAGTGIIVLFEETKKGSKAVDNLCENCLGTGFLERMQP